MADAETWGAILHDALEESLKKQPNKAIRGTILKQSIDRAAAKRNLSFPPVDEPALRLGAFLERHRDLILVSRPSGRDLIVAPVGQPELLLAAVEDRGVGGRVRPAPGIRSDLFKAFTHIQSSETAWYDRTADRIAWSPAGALPPREGLVEIPSPTLVDALRARHEFAESRDAELRASLEIALASDRPLSAFSNQLRDRHLQLEWHKVRTQDLLKEITAWAQRADVPWVDGWLATDTAEGPQGTDGRSWEPTLLELIKSLDSADIARVSIPLDIVLRILQRR